MAHKLQLEKESDIRKMVDKMSKKRKYTMDYIFITVGKRFYLEPKTVEHIIYGQYEKRRLKKEDEKEGGKGQTRRSAPTDTPTTKKPKSNEKA